jgi:hypothetical protein
MGMLDEDDISELTRIIRCGMHHTEIRIELADAATPATRTRDSTTQYTL